MTRILHFSPTSFRDLWILAAAGALVLCTSIPLHAQELSQQGAERALLAKEGYVRPPAVIERIITAPRERNVTLSNPSPDRKHFLKLEGAGLPTIATFGKPHYNLAGLQVDYRANRARALTDSAAAGLELIDAATGRSITVATPKGATISSPAWSPDGSEIAYLADFDDATQLFVADVATGKSRQITRTPVLATLVTTLAWTADGRNVVTVLVPDGRGAEPHRPAIATGPIVRLTEGRKIHTPTYASLLEDPFEKALMAYVVTGQLAAVAVRSKGVRKIGAPAMIYAVSPSPDGQYYHVTLMEKPFSYVVQYQAFPQADQLWDANGRVVAALTKRPAQENPRNDRPDSADRRGRTPGDTAKRSFGWVPNGGGFYYLQQEPAPHGTEASDTSTAVVRPPPAKDRLFVLTAPFSGAPKVLHESDHRMSGVLFGNDGRTAFIAENANGVGQVYGIDLAEPGKRFVITRVRGLTASVGPQRKTFGPPRGGAGADSIAFYLDPGSLVTKVGRQGEPVALLSDDGKYAYLAGMKYFRDWQNEAPHGFVDRVDIRSGAKQRLFEGSGDVFETVTAPLDDDFTRVVVSRESPTVVPDFYLRDIRTGTLTKLTNNKDYAPEITHAQRKRLLVTRPDGYKFWVALTLPEAYAAGTRLPAMFWFYPFEYTDQASYDRTKRNENKDRFLEVQPRSIEMLVTQGYAVVQPDAPIVGQAGRMNDNYVDDLRNNLTAVIDELDRLGYIDRERLGIGGHSYGAFSTVNAMVHTPYFKAGIAGDGDYNRTLTPNGFQSERRDLWDARETYLSMSPFLYANHLQGALLMYHSLEDQNTGTDPINSIRLLHALQGMGKTAALYMYPYEDHGPLTKETILDQWARWTAWLDLYVKNAGKGEPKKSDKVAAR